MNAQTPDIRAQPPHGDDRPPQPFTLVLPPRQWLAVAVLAAAVLAGVRQWMGQRLRPSDGDYRLPARMSEDYWFVSRLPDVDASAVLLLGDSVMWGHYVPADRTLTALLNRRMAPARFINMSVNGLHPAAMRGLVRHYGQRLARRSIVLHMNPLWLSSPRHDLSSDLPVPVNHPRLLPQFAGAPACCRDNLTTRLAIVVERTLPTALWAGHLRAAYFDGMDIPAWSIEHPYACPAGRLVAAGGADDWRSAAGDGRTWMQRAAEFRARWVRPDRSYQWSAFEQTLDMLRRRGCRVFVLVGPLNEHMMSEDDARGCRAMVKDISSRLARDGVAHIVLPLLASEQYADASHPLAAGYDVLAAHLAGDEAFCAFVRGR